MAHVLTCGTVANRGAGLIGLVVVQVVKRLPSLKKVDGVPVSLEEREAAEASRA